jgi:hypothetical protein
MDHSSGKGEAASSFRSGYAASMKEWASPRNQAICRLQEVFEKPSASSFRAALQRLKDQGVDINDMVLQDTPRSWFNLAPFLISKNTKASQAMFSLLLQDPDVDLNLQRAQVYNRYARYFATRDKPVEAVIKPFIHVFIVGWAPYMSPPTIKPGVVPTGMAKVNHDRSLFCRALMEKFQSMKLDWRQVDSKGNTLAHELFARASGTGCQASLPWLLSLDLDLSATNNDGYTAASLARQRLGAEGPRRQNDKDHSSYEWAFAELESVSMQRRTCVSAPGVGYRAPRL